MVQVHLQLIEVNRIFVDAYLGNPDDYNRYLYEEDLEIHLQRVFDRQRKSKEKIEDYARRKGRI